MKDSEAAELVSFLRAAFPSLTDNQERVYVNLLAAEQDADAASKAILDGVKVWKYTPSFAQIREAVRIEKDRRRVSAPRPAEPSRDTSVPEWVWVWRWARQDRQPLELRPLHYQERYVDPTEMLDEAEYERLRQGWVEAGSPTAPTPLIGFVK